MKRLIYTLSIVFLLTLTGTLYSQNISLGVAAKASTTGLGGDVIVKFHERMTARVGFDLMGYERGFKFEEQDVTYDATAQIKLGTISALYDFHITPLFFASAGLAVNNFNIFSTGKAASDFPYGDISIPAEKVGSFEIEVYPSMKISPYLGLGVGNLLNTEKRVGFAFELGALYQGSPNIDIQTEGLISPTSNPDHGQKELLERQVSQYYLYPVMRLSLSVRIL